MATICVCVGGGGDASGNRMFPLGESGHVASCANRGTALTLTESVIFLGRYSVAPSKALVSPMMSLNSFIKAKRTLLESTFGLYSERERGEGTMVLTQKVQSVSEWLPKVANGITAI